MIWHGLALTVSVATTVTVVALVVREYYKKIAASGTAIFLWLAAAAGSPTISYPYTKMFENAADNTYEIVTGVHHVSGPVSWLSWAWLGMAIIMALYLWYSVTSQASKEMRSMGR